ncbi:MAG: carboxypeptidase regulatory-like domain-containing protein, partial [bacterium]
GLARCDVSGDGVCDVGDYARIRRFMIELSGGLDETCPLAGSTLPAVVLALPVVDQGSTISTDRSSVRLTGTGEPGELIRVEGVPSVPSVGVDADGTWAVEVPLVLEALNTLDLRRDFGGGYLSEPSQLSVTQTDATGEGVLRGIVVDASNDEAPIESATVRLNGVSTTTDAIGRFRLDGLPEGSAILRVTSPGHVPGALEVVTNATAFSEEDGLSGDGLRIALASMAPTQTIGSGGGTLTTTLGFELIVPPGSLATDTEIALTELVGTGVSSLGGLATVDIGPGPISFDPPAILRMPISGFGPGQPVGFAQVDQGDGAVTPVLGASDASGFVEVEIHSSNGDQIESFGAYKSEAEFPQGGGGVPTEGLTAVSNCDGSLPLSTSTIGARRPELFTGDPLGGADPLLRARLEANPRELMQIKGLLKPAEATAQEVIVPPGSRALLRVTGSEVTVEQPIYVYRYPEEGGAASKNRLGTLRYQVLVPTLVAIDRIEPCPRPKASAWGDPHLIRFDHVGQALPNSSGDGRFDFQAAGEFVLFESTEDDLAVQARMVPANGSTTVINAAAMNVDGDRVSIYSALTLDVRVEGVPTPLTLGVPFPLPGGGELERDTTPSGKDRVTVRWSDGTELKISEWTTSLSYLNLFPRLAASRFGRVRGLLGNGNGVIGDDLNLRDGTPSTPADLYTTYADSWRISQAESLFDYEPGEDTTTYNGVPADPDYTVADLDPVAVAAAEADCIAAGITEDPLLSDCIIDVVVFGDASATGPAGEAQTEVPDVGLTVSVPATSNIWGAGLSSVPDFGDAGTGNGTLPPLVPLPPGTGRSIRLLDATGNVRYFPTENPPCPPDGKQRSAETSFGIWGGLAGPISERRCALVAVFLSDDQRPAEVPPQYHCGNLTDEFIAPEVGQIFCPGDGLTPSLEVQQIFVPDDATRLYLGLLARFQEGRPPGWYGDNSGTHEAILEIVVPE